MTWVGGILYYRETNPTMSSSGQHALAEIIAEG